MPILGSLTGRPSGRVRRRFARRPGARAALACAVATAVVLTGCSGLRSHLSGAGPSQASLTVHSYGPPAAWTHLPSPGVSVLTDTTQDALTAAFAARLFASAPVVVVSAGSGAALRTAEKAATAACAPLLLGTASPSAPLLAEIKGLRPRDVLAVGLPPAALAARLPGVRVVTSAARLPVTAAPLPRPSVLVIVHHGSMDQAAAAVTTTARVAGATVLAMEGWDPRAYPPAIKFLAKARPREVLAVGRGFGPASRLTSRLTVAETGTQLPSGGQVLFPGHRLVALYGHPGTPGLGVLGDQDLPGSIARARQVAAQYRPLSAVPVVPAFEIIATVAQAHPGFDGSYSYQTPVSDLTPWVREANAAGVYVILDLQPGRASLLTQAEHYQSLLERPDVGLALDGEWKLQPGQLPLHQIGSVSVEEVNSVIRWLAALTARYHLPQKVLVLHQFRLSMLLDEQRIDTGYDDLAILIHMDGQGSPGSKQATWNAVTAAAPPHVWFGWKNFYVKDHPMITPSATMSETPTPVMISYQ